MAGNVFTLPHSISGIVAGSDIIGPNGQARQRFGFLYDLATGTPLTLGFIGTPTGHHTFANAGSDNTALQGSNDSGLFVGNYVLGGLNYVFVATLAVLWAGAVGEAFSAEAQAGISRQRFVPPPWDALPLRSLRQCSASAAATRKLGEFGVVRTIGGNIPCHTRVVSAQISEHIKALEYSQAHALSSAAPQRAFA